MPLDAFPIMKTCTKERLATRGHCQVELCDCGVLHLTFGPVTFRTTPEMARELHAMLGDAFRALTQREVEAHVRETPESWASAAAKPGEPS